MRIEVSFVVVKVTVEQDFLLELLFSPVSIIARTLHIHLHLHVALTRRTKDRSLGAFQKAMLFWKSGNTG